MRFLLPVVAIALSGCLSSTPTLDPDGPDTRPPGERLVALESESWDRLAESAHSSATLPENLPAGQATYLGVATLEVISLNGDYGDFKTVLAGRANLAVDFDTQSIDGAVTDWVGARGIDREIYGTGEVFRAQLFAQLDENASAVSGSLALDGSFGPAQPEVGENSLPPPRVTLDVGVSGALRLDGRTYTVDGPTIGQFRGDDAEALDLVSDTGRGFRVLFNGRDTRSYFLLLAGR